jgi:hypothetical protein
MHAVAGNQQLIGRTVSALGNNMRKSLLHRKSLFKAGSQIRCASRRIAF